MITFDGLLRKLVPDRTNTYYFEMESNMMVDHGISKGAILIVDKSVTIEDGCIVVAHHKGEWITRLISQHKLICQGDPDVNITSDTNIFGVVTWSCSPFLPFKKH